MRKLNFGNVKKTWNYLKRNGLRDTYLAALERLREKEKYEYRAPGAEILESQRKQSLADGDIRFTILVPAYRTDGRFLKEMIDSVLAQSYPNFELLISDAGHMQDQTVRRVAKQYRDERIRYIPLEENRGISGNTNEILKLAGGSYIGLLDHDDILSPDALFEMYSAIKKCRAGGVEPKILYSDEDKCDESGEKYYEAHKKTEFNLDLILSNNYICHFLVMQADLMKGLQLRGEYDGAQDYDLILRALDTLYGEQGDGRGKFSFAQRAEKEIVHIDKVLYHWRCHSASTAQNPQSKRYAYEAGRRALEDFIEQNGWKAHAGETKHVGFYRVRYKNLFRVRPDVGIVGGPIYGRGNKITGGIYDSDGNCPYEGLRRGFDGYMHRAGLTQDAYAVDIRRIKLKKELEEEPEIAGLLRQPAASEEEYRKRSIRICEKCRELGYRVLWLPD